MTFKLEVRAIRPAKWKIAEIIPEIEAALKQLADAVETDFDATTETWSSRPRFTKRYAMRGGVATMSVTTDDERWARLNQGFKTGPKFARKGKVLKFRPGYTAKTRPRVFKSFRGGPFGEFIYRPRAGPTEVEARAWTDEAQKKYQRRMWTAVNVAVVRGIAKGVSAKARSILRR